MEKIKVLLLFGGESSEHEVSIASAGNVHDAMNKDRYDIHLCYIDRSGKWWLVESMDKLDTAMSVVPRVGEKSILVTGISRVIDLDVIFPVLHGRNGEDGSMQGLAQLMHLPIVGCDVTSSGIAMNKLACKKILKDADVPVIPYSVHRAYNDVPDYGMLVKKLGQTMFVKPARSGSSVGVSKVTNEDDLRRALDEAHRYDPIALIEKAMPGKELEVAVLGTPPNHKVSGVGEVIAGEEFYSYEDKYSDDSKAEVKSKADIDEETSEKIRAISKRVYEVLDCSNLARIDFVLDTDGKPYVMEINTLPGFTDISMYPKLWQEQGISYSELIDRLVNDAIENVTIINTER